MLIEIKRRIPKLSIGFLPRKNNWNNQMNTINKFRKSMDDLKKFYD